MILHWSHCPRSTCHDMPTYAYAILILIFHVEWWERVVIECVLQKHAASRLFPFTHCRMAQLHVASVDPEQLQIGQTVCKVSPDNTESVPPATSLEDCRCKKGYYSPVYDATQMYGMPGFACLECSSADFTLILGITWPKHMVFSFLGLNIIEYHWISCF